MKIRCDRPNAGTNINGVAFEPLDGGGMITVDDVDRETEEMFLSIPGYHAHLPEGFKQPNGDDADADAAAAAAEAAAPAPEPAPAPAPAPAPDSVNNEQPARKGPGRPPKQ